MPPLVLLKLGGSLITDKDQPYTVRQQVLTEVCKQISTVLSEAFAAATPAPTLRLILGHGSGSFGHAAAVQHRTHDGIEAGADSAARRRFWEGFAEVRFRAAQLNTLVMEATHSAGIAAAAFPPSAAVLCRDRKILQWDLVPMQNALTAGLLPVVYGDVVFDEQRGGTIASTEDLFVHLARVLKPQRILLAGFEAGVWADFPSREVLLPHLTPSRAAELGHALSTSSSADVTGGMQSKVRQMLDLVREMPHLAVQVFSGEEPGAVERALRGAEVGTSLRAE